MKTSPSLKVLMNIILVFVFSIFLNSCNLKTSKESAQYIIEPQVGDLYFIEEVYGVFTVMKIASINNNSVSFNLSRFNKSMAREIDVSYNSLKYKTTQYLDQPDYYWADSLKNYSKSELIKLYDDKIIYEINRD